jgi:hypothetical protein
VKPLVRRDVAAYLFPRPVLPAGNMHFFAHHQIAAEWTKAGANQTGGSKSNKMTKDNPAERTWIKTVSVLTLDASLRV